jgi:hypothetical protein
MVRRGRVCFCLFVWAPLLPLPSLSLARALSLASARTSNRTGRPAPPAPPGTVSVVDRKAAPTVTAEAGSNSPRARRRARQDLPTPLSPSRTSLTRGGVGTAVVPAWRGWVAGSPASRPGRAGPRAAGVVGGRGQEVEEEKNTHGG